MNRRRMRPYPKGSTPLVPLPSPPARETLHGCPATENWRGFREYMAQRSHCRGSWTSHLRVAALTAFGSNDLRRNTGMAKRRRAGKILGQLCRGRTGSAFADQHVVGPTRTARLEVSFDLSGFVWRCNLTFNHGVEGSSPSTLTILRVVQPGDIGNGSYPRHMETFQAARRTTGSGRPAPGLAMRVTPGMAYSGWA